MRLGRIGYINCYPVYGAIDRGLVPLPADLVTGTPSELNDLLAAGELDVSVVSAVEYARNARDYVLLPDLAISCDGPVRSVALFSRRPAVELDRAPVLLTASSRTSVHLLELLCTDVWRVQPRFAQVRAEAADLDGLAGLPHEAVQEIHRALLASRDWGLGHLDLLAAAAARACHVPRVTCLEYFTGLDYALSYKHLAGLTDFFRRLAARGLVPDGSLRFLQVA